MAKEQANSIMSFRSNTQTPANSEQGANAQAVSALLPNTVAAKAMAERLFSNSGHNSSILDTIAPIPNGQIQFKLLNTGLTDRVIVSFKGSIKLKNADTKDVIVKIAPEAPFNFIQNWNALFNGQTTVFSASGYETMALMNKRWKGTLLNNGALGSRSDNNVRVSRKFANITCDDKGTLNAGNGLCGYDSVTVKASQTATISFQMILFMPFVMREDIPIGLLAMQNNSITCNISISTSSVLGTSASTPFYISDTVPQTLTVDSASITGLPVQEYWETPDNAQLYAYFIANSYMYISAPNQTCQSTGQRALHYNLGNNFVLTGMLFTMRDNHGDLLDIINTIDNFELNYNNTVSVGRMPMDIRSFMQERYYEGAPTGLGQLLWDATTHEFQTNGLSDADFLDLYMANNPQVYCDVNSKVPVPINYSVATEMLVPSQVKIA